MYLDQNIDRLRKKFTYVKWDKLREYCDNEGKRVVKETSKSGINTLKVCVDDVFYYLHSKFDPLSEAGRIADSLELDKAEQHLLLYGIGLGYVLDVFRERRPDITYSIYEPSAAVFLKFLDSRKLSDGVIEALRSIYICEFMSDNERDLLAFFQKLGFRIKLAALPSYERIYPKNYSEFSRRFKDSITDKRIMVATKYKKEKLWVENAMKNFPYTIMSENILNLSEQIFCGKPAILVSSGPSLDEEIGNLKKIKDAGRAYIFTAGSAVYKLLRHDIYPDAVCAIDGSETNNDIYRGLFENSQNKVPLIFTDMLYHNIASSYNAKIYNAIMDDDRMAAYYLKYKSGNEVKKVRNAPSVALFTLQIMQNLQCDPIVLVGQNFALKGDYYYANGIDFHKNRQAREKASGGDMKEAFQVEDVNGGKVYTLKNLDMMRRNMEVLINLCPKRNIINTTNGGAKISGSKYLSLSKLMKDVLNISVVNPNWQEIKTENYDIGYILEQHKLMLQDYAAISDTIEDIEEEIAKIETAVQKDNEKKLEVLLFDFSSTIKKLTRNRFYETFVYPMNTLQVEILSSSLRKIAREENIIKKGREAHARYKDFIADTKDLIMEIEPLFLEFSQKIQGLDVLNR